MPCELHDEAWSAMLQARRHLQAGSRGLVFLQRDGAWSCATPHDADLDGTQQILLVGTPPTAEPTTARCSVYHDRPGQPPEFSHPHDHPIDNAMQAFARVYLPVLLGAAAARREGRVFVTAHVTQTLDGRIACDNGQSQWIGNEEDLRHAHRMRALLEGVLVGAKTVLQDDPRLTVRHVDGDNPRRLMLSGNANALRSATPRHLYDPPGSIAIVSSDTDVTSPSEHVQVVPVQPAGNGDLPPNDVLQAIAGHGIHSIYLEGGAKTVSSFMQAAAIDLLQVHIAAMLLGSGLSGFSLPAVEHVSDGQRLVMDHATLDGHLLLTCWPPETRA